jgi:hypothetical protein
MPPSSTSMSSRCHCKCPFACNISKNWSGERGWGNIKLIFPTNNFWSTFCKGRKYPWKSPVCVRVTLPSLCNAYISSSKWMWSPSCHEKRVVNMTSSPCTRTPLNKQLGGLDFFLPHCTPVNQNCRGEGGSCCSEHSKEGGSMSFSLKNRVPCSPGKKELLHKTSALFCPNLFHARGRVFLPILSLLQIQFHDGST